jgi:hypothetical protein
MKNGQPAQLLRWSAERQVRCVETMFSLWPQATQAYAMLLLQKTEWE